eukprot:scaffold6610_cov163-Amphora_coffeaeformis.AAC.7
MSTLRSAEFSVIAPSQPHTEGNRPMKVPYTLMHMICQLRNLTSFDGSLFTMSLLRQPTQQSSPYQSMTQYLVLSNSLAMYYIMVCCGDGVDFFVIRNSHTTTLPKDDS